MVKYHNILNTSSSSSHVKDVKYGRMLEVYQEKNSNEVRIFNSQILKDVEEFEKRSKALDLSIVSDFWETVFIKLLEQYHKQKHVFLRSM